MTDAWSRTYRSQAVTFASAAGAQQSRNGIRIFPDEVAASWPAERLLPSVGNGNQRKRWTTRCSAITARYGTRTTDFVAMQLEYPRQRSDSRRRAKSMGRAHARTNAIRVPTIYNGNADGWWARR